MLRRGALAAAATCCALLASCARLPEPESAGAKLYVDRCTGCHRAYQPGAMKFEMWKLVVNRMQGVMSRNGMRPLTEDDTDLLLDYLQRNSG